jgi:hypothetical protein
MIPAGTKFIAINTDDKFNRVWTIEEITAAILTGGYNVVTVSANYTVLATDNSIICQSGPFTVSLPTAIGITGRRYTITSDSDGYITVNPFGSQTINSQLQIILTKSDSMTIESDGSNWRIV